MLCVVGTCWWTLTYKNDNSQLVCMTYFYVAQLCTLSGSSYINSCCAFSNEDFTAQTDFCLLSTAKKYS